MEKELRFEVKLGVKDLWQFSMYHANAGMLGIVNVLFTLAALFLIVTRWGTLTTPYRALLVVCALMFTVWQPLLLYNKARKQAKGPAVKEPMILTFGEEGLRVTQNEQEAVFSWEQMGRLDKMPTMVILYMDRVHAYLLPKSVMGEQEEPFYEMVRAHLPKERRRRI